MTGRLWIATFLILTSLAQAAPEKPKPSPSGDAKDVKSEGAKSDPALSDPQITTATFGDWTERCQRINASDGVRRICEVALVVTASGQSQPLAEVAVGRVKKSVPLRLTLVLPVNVAFPSAPTVAVAGADPLELAWKQCVPAGCFADAVLEAQAMEAWRTAKSARVESRTASGAKLGFEISLRGFTSALDVLIREP